MTIGEYRQRCLLSRPSGTLSSTRSGGEGWGEEVPIGEATGYHLELVLVRARRRLVYLAGCTRKKHGFGRASPSRAYGPDLSRKKR